MPEFERTEVPSLDILGVILAPIAFSMLVYGVNEGSKSWTLTNTLVSLTVGSIALIIFIFVELSQKEPLIELKVFGSWDFLSAIVVLSIFQIVMYSVVILAPLYLQNVKGYTALQTGFLTSRVTYNMANIKNKLSAAINSYDNVFLLCVFIAIIGLVLSLLIRKTKAKEQGKCSLISIF